MDIKGGYGLLDGSMQMNSGNNQRNIMIRKETNGVKENLKTKSEDESAPAEGRQKQRTINIEDRGILLRIGNSQRVEGVEAKGYNLRRPHEGNEDVTSILKEVLDSIEGDINVSGDGVLVMQGNVQDSKGNGSTSIMADSWEDIEKLKSVVNGQRKQK